MAGSATWSAGTKSLVGGVAVFKEMLRIGTQACPDLAPLYNQYVAAEAPAVSPATDEDIS
jgi:hypothetical protein